MKRWRLLLGLVLVKLATISCVHIHNNGGTVSVTQTVAGSAQPESKP